MLPHDGRILRDALMGERGRDQLTALAVLLSLADEESIAQQRTRKRAQRGAFLVIVNVFDEDFGHQVRRIHQHYVDAAERRSADAGNFRAQLFQHADAAAEKRTNTLNYAQSGSVAYNRTRGMQSAMTSLFRQLFPRAGASTENPDSIAASPRFYPTELKIERHPPTISFVEVTQETYRRSSFLDHRMHREPKQKTIVCEVGKLLAACQGAP